MRRWLALGVLVGGFLTPAALPAQGKWTREVRAPTRRTEVAVAVRGGEIFVIGGLTPRGVTRLVEVYDPRKRRWRTAAPLPEAVHHPGAGVVGERLYVVGGFGGGSFWAGTDTLYEYLPRPNVWRKRAPMPTARGALGVGVIDGKLYAVGGRDQRGDVAANEVYDPATDTWKRLAPMPTARDHLAAAALRGRLHAIGGRLGSYARNLGIHEVFDPRTDAWETRRPLPTPRSGIAAAVLDGRIFVFGGESVQGTFADNEGYDPERDRWRRFAPMPRARHGLGAATWGGRIFVLTGGPRPGGSYSGANESFAP